MADRTPVDDQNDGAVGFLQRWSRRKRHGDAAEPDVDEAVAERPEAPSEEFGDAGDIAETRAPEDPDADDRIDPRTGKRFDELTDADMPEVESLDQNSDVSAFLARGISQGLRLAALRKLWHTPKFNQLDLMTEYSGNYTNYEKLGSIVPHDMKRAVDRELERERKRQEELEARARDDAEARQASAERHEAEQGDDLGTAEPDAGQNDPGVADGSGSDGPAVGDGESFAPPPDGDGDPGEYRDEPAGKARPG